MTRKDYVIFAELFKKYVQYREPVLPRGIVYDAMDIFKTDNPNFDRRRFLKACGMEE